MPRKVPKPAFEGADVDEMLSIEVEESTLSELAQEMFENTTAAMVLVRCLAPFLKKSNHKRCYRADTFEETEEWVLEHEADLERL